MASAVDGDIAMIPSDFTIERTAYNAEDAEVTVLERFRQNNFTERRRYTYYLRRENGGSWSIVDYVVINLGTE
jgi:ketosteroid isomerase-like protein